MTDSDKQHLSKEEILKLIVNQLQFYEFNSIARVVADTTGVEPTVEPSNSLAEYAAIGKKVAEQKKNLFGGFIDGSGLLSDADLLDMNITASADETIHIDGGYENEPASEEGPVEMFDLEDGIEYTSKPPPEYKVYYDAPHKGLVRAANFSDDGSWVVTGNSDGRLRVFDVHKMYQKGGTMDGKDDAFVKIMSDHTMPIRDVVFHPSNLIVASCSDDKHIRFFDVTKEATRKSFRFITDSHAVKSISFHPAGNFILAGTDHEILRMYDVHTFKCFTTSTRDAHTEAIKQVRFAPDAKVFASASDDGTIKIWDAINGTIVNTISSPHPLIPGAGKLSIVSSIQFSKNSKYLLSAGRDSIVKIWDWSSGQVVKSYEGASQKSTALPASFTPSESHIISPSESTNELICWDAYAGEIVNRFSGHAGSVRGIVPNPGGKKGWLSCGDDSKALYWNT
ncbi:WD40-repeat-containing domain protein [Paraphysoderma sedebokerense]|nr:WD40-repeat-containing domain protein [Paraphysoderma sedebokerense]